MKNNKMYLTETEAKAKGLPSNQEQIDRYNRAVRASREEAKSLRLTNGMECFTCTVTVTDERGAAELMDSNGARYYRDDYNGGWSSDAADELVTVIRDGESDEDAKARLLAEVR